MQSIICTIPAFGVSLMCTNPSSFFTTVSFAAAAARFYCFLWEKPPTLYTLLLVYAMHNYLLVLCTTYYHYTMQYQYLVYYHHIPILSCLQPLHHSHFSPVLHMYTPGALDEIWTGCPVITFQAFADLTGMNTIQRPHHEVITFLKLHLIFF